MHEFYENFERYVLPEPNSGCWLWTGYIMPSGYGRFCPKFRMAPLYAHRYSYEVHKGPIPEGLVIDHLCRLPCCVNPDHLEPVPQAVNVKRGNAGINHRSKTHCKRGHEFTADNILNSKRRVRVCRICENARSRLKYRRLKEKTNDRP